MQFKNGIDKMVLQGADVSTGLENYVTISAASESDTLISFRNGFIGTVKLVGVQSSDIEISDFVSSLS